MLRRLVLLAFDLEEREGAQRLRSVLAGAACGTPRGSRRPRACDAPRSACRADDRRARRRRRTPPPRPRPRSSMLGRAEVLDQLLRQRVDRGAARSSSLASTICTSVDQPSDATPRKPARNAARALPSSWRDRRPRTRRRPTPPIRRARRRCSNTNVSDGSSRMVRSSFTRAALRVCGIEPATASASAGTSVPALDLGLAHAPHQQIAVVVDVAAHALLGRRAAPDSSSRPSPKPCSCQASIAHHEMAREALDQPAGAEIVEAFLLERGRRAAAGPARLRPSRRCGSCRRTPATPAARPRGAVGPGQPPAADQAAIDVDRVRPVERRSASPAAHARPARRRAPPCRHRRRAARCAAARPAPAPRRIRRGRSGRHRPACRRRARPHAPWHARRRRRPRAASRGGRAAAGRAPARGAR